MRRAFPLADFTEEVLLAIASQAKNFGPVLRSKYVDCVEPAFATGHRKEETMTNKKLKDCPAAKRIANMIKD
jgi:hypothetical protein